ncbi:MAG: AgmX/PglI C-terminal domain-containing protein [Proteobacteria bacterium]|jgi:hypothetical protein|nr:AgmX/PglI C-terminal domain-containing protein [Pseudomonadota bacterium]
MRRALIVAAVFLVALVAAYLLGSGRLGKIGHPPRAAAAAASTAREGNAKSREGEGTVRRLKSRAERDRLVALIENARRVRAARGAGGRGGGGDTDSDGAEGALSKSIIQEGVRAVIGDIQACYEDALERTPNLEGKLVARFEIIGEPDAGGVIDHAEIDDATDSALRSEAELTGCIIESIYTIELPRPENGGRVTVEYPFYLSPGSDEKR